MIILGLFYIEDYFLIREHYTCPRQDFEGQLPDDFYRLKKRYFIVRINNETIKKSFQSYFVQIKHQSGDFINYFIEFYQDNNVTNKNLNEIDWYSLFFTTK